MCEYCGCQAVTAIDALTREHEVALAHSADARHAAEAADYKTAQQACAALAEVLRPHSAIEERGLFVVMAREFGDKVGHLVDDHRLIERVLEEMARPEPPAGWRERLLDVLIVLREHILKEQDGVFPAALATLTPGEWDALEAVRRDVATASPADRRHVPPSGVRMEKSSLTATARQQLQLAGESSSGRSAHTVYGGHEHVLRQTVIALSAGQRLDEHENPGEATVHVLQGRVLLASGAASWEGSPGDLLIVPQARHSLEALEASVVLLTVAKLSAG